VYDIYDLDGNFIAGEFDTYHDAAIYRNKLQLHNPIKYRITTSS